jgi:hypothetical protein
VILFAGPLSPRIESWGADVDLSIAGGAATPAAATDGFSADTWITTPFGSSTRRPPQPTMKSSAVDRSAATARKPFGLIFTGTKPDYGPASAPPSAAVRRHSAPSPPPAASANDRTTTREHPPPDNTSAPSSLTAADPQEDAATILLT